MELQNLKPTERRIFETFNKKKHIFETVFFFYFSLFFIPFYSKIWIRIEVVKIWIRIGVVLSSGGLKPASAISH